MLHGELPKNLVLYADDDIDDVEMVKDGFSANTQNVELKTFSDGDEVIDYIKVLATQKVKPCLVILDINMPRMNGRDALLQLRAFDEFEKVPVIMFTTSSNKIDKQFAKDNNAGFITKPIDVKQLNIIVNHFIDHCEDSIQQSIRIPVGETSH